jgi:hypothetical protein
MIELVPFNPVHLLYIELIDTQQYMVDLFIDPEYQRLLMQCEPQTVIADGKIIGCGGVFKTAPHIGRVWSFLSVHSGPHMMFLTRKTIERLRRDDMPPRLEAIVRSDYGAGRRWVEVMGFKNETPEGMAAYGFNGETYSQYSLVRKT